MIKKSTGWLLLLAIAVALIAFIFQQRWISQVPALESTVLIDVIPTPPSTTATGLCWARSELIALANAWRCGVDDGPEKGTVYDPCFSQSDERYVICGVEPAMNRSGVQLTLQEPLPMPLLDQQTPQLWQIKLVDGAICTILAGPTLSFDNQSLRYQCDDGAFVLGDLKSRVSWHAEKVHIELREARNILVNLEKIRNEPRGIRYRIIKQENIPVRTVWRAALPPTLTTISPIALLNGIYQINNEQIKLRAGQFDSKAQASGFSRTVYRLKFYDDSLWRSDGDLNEDGSRDAVVLLTEQTGNSDSYTYLAVMLNFDGIPLNAATYILGQELIVHNLLIENGQVQVTLTIEGIDGITQTEQRDYTLVNDQLVERERKVLRTPIKER